MFDRDVFDELRISGLSDLLDEETELPVVELKLQCQGRAYLASILTADGEWALSMREAGGPHLAGVEVMYESQNDAIVAAMIRVLEVAANAL